jgi:hypothetical protein
LSNAAVGEFIGDNFEATHQKVGTFVVAGGQKQGGNVASYFCLSDGTVVHAVAGPLDAGQFLREAKWAAEVRKLAVAESGGEVSKYRATIRKAHVERLAVEHGVSIQLNALPKIAPGAPPVPVKNVLRTNAARRVGGTQGLVHLVLAHAPQPKLSQLYPIVFEGILKERLSALPVQTR